jgi:medium-chain acyl-[acyl-carrier-protein] hydrolase
MGSVYQKEFTISSYDLNPRGQARLTTMANFFQEMAYFQATELGYGYEDMKERDTLWVLSRMKIRIDRYPEWKNRIKIETWPSGTDKLFALRNFRVRDETGEEIGKATTYWLIIDIASRRPIRPNADMKFVWVIHDEQVFDTPLVKIEFPGEPELLDPRRVLYSDLDIIGHVNNVKYMEWCIDLAMQEQGPNKEIGEVEINFMQEALLGDEIQISGKMDQTGNSFFLAHRKEDGREVFRARLALRVNDADQAGNPS